MDRQSTACQKIFETVWGPEGSYRVGSSGERYVDRFLMLAGEIKMVNDYGAGTGRAALKFLSAGIEVHMVDVATNALEKEALDLLDGDVFTWTHASLWDLPVTFPYADWGYCVSVLQTIPMDKLYDALNGIFLTCEKLFVSIIGWQEKYFGVEVHPIVKDRAWWRDRLGCFWPRVEDVLNPEDNRRHDFICRVM
jgi:hypothetical protein